jgi:hypothetical protein
MLYMFQAVPPPIIRSSKTILKTKTAIITDAVCIVFELLIMGGGTT